MADEESDAAPDAETPPEQSEQRFAENLRDWRERRGISQVKLAQEMATRGWPWRQQTVTRVESGQRMVRLGEALAVAEILGTSVAMLTASTREAGAVSLLTSANSKAKEAYGQIVDWTEALLQAQGHLRTSVASAEDAEYFGSPLVEQAAVEAAGVLELTPEQAVSEARGEAEDLRETIAEYNQQIRLIDHVIRAYVDDGMSIRAISKTEPLSERQVREVLEGNGVKIRGRRRGDTPATPAIDNLATSPADDGGADGTY